MKPREISSDALRLIIQIGGVLEQRVLDRARELTACRRPSDVGPAIISECDVRNALSSVLESEESGLRFLFENQEPTRRDARQAG